MIKTSLRFAFSSSSHDPYRIPDIAKRANELFRIPASIIFGKVAKGRTAHCIHGGAAFVWPIIQDYQMMDLTPVQIDIGLENALSKQNIRVSVPAVFTIGISTKEEIMISAAERLLGMNADTISKLSEEIIIGQMRLCVAQMDIEEINADRDKFLKAIFDNVESELEKVGLRLINVNIKDIRDESGYLDALGKNAAAEALNRAKKQVAEKNRDGAIGEAQAVQEQTVKVAEANATAESGKADAAQRMRVNVANANAKAVEGENLATVNIANSTSDMRQKKAEAEKMAIASEKVQAAKALEEAYKAEQIAETARAERDRATRMANEIVAADIERQKVVIAAEAAKTKAIKEAEGQAEANYAVMEAQGRGIREILSKQAEGLQNIVKAAGGNPDKAATLLIIDKLPELVKTQVEAISNLKIDKITVWDNGANGGQTANFLSGLIGSVPPLQNIFKMAGMNLPEFMGRMDEPDRGPAPKPQDSETKK